MQHDSLAIPQWILESLKWLAGISAGGLIVRLVTLYQNRHKPAAELHRTDAETTEITVRASSSASDAVMRMMSYLTQAQVMIDRLRDDNGRLREERDCWQDEYDKVFVERNDLAQRNDLLKQETKTYAKQIEQMHAVLKLHGLNYDNSQPKQN